MRKKFRAWEPNKRRAAVIAYLLLFLLLALGGAATEILRLSRSGAYAMGFGFGIWTAVVTFYAYVWISGLWRRRKILLVLRGERDVSDTSHLN